MTLMFKSIEYKLILLLFCLVIVVSCTTLLFVSKEYLYGCIALLFAFYILIRLYKSYKNFNSNILFLLSALENGDYSFHFTETKRSKREKELNQMLNRIKETLIKARKEVVENEIFLGIVIESVSTGIILLDDKNNIVRCNIAANRLLGLPILSHLNQLKTVDSALPDTLRRMKPNDTTQIRITNEKECVQISVRLSEVSIKRGIMKIITLNNIGNELETKEMESWIRLIRVMTHEIMNSIAPITSLSQTLIDTYFETYNAQPDINIIEGLKTINTTAKGLISFVETYREFTGIPQPVLSDINLIPFLEKILRLESSRLEERCIETRIIPHDKHFILKADEILLTRILVNLIKNAEEALESQSNGIIEIRIIEEPHAMRIEICNNGTPISPEVAPHIFIPFFTTKKGGSGIGLSVSRYIMRLHGGNLKHHTSNGWTVFSMVFE